MTNEHLCVHRYLKTHFCSTNATTVTDFHKKLPKSAANHGKFTRIGQWPISGYLATVLHTSAVHCNSLLWPPFCYLTPHFIPDLTFSEISLFSTTTSCNGELAQVVECLLSMREERDRWLYSPKISSASVSLDLKVLYKCVIISIIIIVIITKSV